ncbi:MAG: putative toxin-antitoxin system toxin component, PIN family [Bacteroidia bacterium]|nr:putative toxin-antitoxin system toxin component, PIN family [Bacteroidia bacterium]
MQIKQSRIVIDTNIWISYLITKGFKRLDKLIYSDKVLLVFSQELIDEFLAVAIRPKFRKYFSPNDVVKLLEIFDTYGELIIVKSNIIVCRDLKDNFLLSLSVDSQADFLITGDNDLLEIKEFGKTNILTITDFESLS